MPSANDLGFARSQDNSFNAFLVVLVVAAVFGVNTAALGSNLTHVIPAGLQFETCFTILVAVSMIVADLMSTSVLPQRFHVSEHIHPPLHRETVTVVVVVPVLGFVVRIWLHRSCDPSSNHEYFIAKKLLPRSCGSPLLQNELWTTTIRQYTLAQFLLVDVHESIHPCLCGNTRPGLRYSCDVRVLYDVDLLLLPSTWKTLSMLARPRNHSSAPGFQIRMVSLPSASEYIVTGLTFLSTSNHTEILGNVLVSVPQFSVAMLTLATDISSCVHTNFIASIGNNTSARSA